jgi:hypothetical protein
MFFSSINYRFCEKYRPLDFHQWFDIIGKTVNFAGDIILYPEKSPG